MLAYFQLEIEAMLAYFCLLAFCFLHLIVEKNKKINNMETIYLNCYLALFVFYCFCQWNIG